MKATISFILTEKSVMSNWVQKMLMFSEHNGLPKPDFIRQHISVAAGIVVHDPKPGIIRKSAEWSAIKRGEIFGYKQLKS